MLSFIPNTSVLSNYQTINIPNLKNSIYVKENEHDENYATNLTILLPEGSVNNKIELSAIRTITDQYLIPDAEQGHTLPFSSFQTIEGSDTPSTSNQIIVPAGVKVGNTVEPRGGVIIQKLAEGIRMWPIINKFTKPIKTYARLTLKYVPLGYNILNKLVGVCKIASGDLTGLANVVNVPFYEPKIEEAEFEAADVEILVESQRLADYENGAFLPFSTFSVAI